MEIDHLHGDSVLFTVDRRCGRQVVVRIDRCDHGKIEVLRLIQRAGHHTSVLGLEAHIGVILVVPRHDLGHTLAVASAIHVQT